MDHQISEYLSSFQPGVFVTPEQKEFARQGIERIERHLLSQPQVTLESRDFFAHKTYAKILKIPAGVILTGEVYKEKCINILLKGRITILTGNGVATFNAPEVIVPVPHSKKVGYAHEETLWMNVFGVPDEAYDSHKVMLEYTTKFDPKQPNLWDKKDFTEDYEDYGKFLQEYGFTLLQAEQLSRQPHITFDQEYSCSVGKSEIHGVGLIATRDFQMGEVIAPAWSHGMRTPAGRFTNHQKNPNSRPQLGIGVDPTIDLVASKEILAGEEITLDYRQSIEITRRLLS